MSKVLLLLLHNSDSLSRWLRIQYTNNRYANRKLTCTCTANAHKYLLLLAATAAAAANLENRYNDQKMYGNHKNDNRK